MRDTDRPFLGPWTVREASSGAGLASPQTFSRSVPLPRVRFLCGVVQLRQLLNGMADVAIVDSMQKITFHEVDASGWDDLERLFESRGGPKSCWCMVWRAGPKTAKGPDRKAAIRRYVRESVPIGLLGYASGEPVAWCSIAPKMTYRDLGGPTNVSELPEEVWSLVCFFVRRDFRGRGLTKQIIEAAVESAASRGAKVVEAYPVEAGSPSYRFMGYVSTFSAAGFHEVGRAGTRRHVMRRQLHC